LARLSTFLIMVALIAGMAGCGQPGTEYTPMVAAGSEHTVGGLRLTAPWSPWDTTTPTAGSAAGC